MRTIYFERLPNSLKLGLAAFVISMLLGVPLGMLSALKAEHLAGQLWQNVRAARTIDAGLLHRPGPGHHLRRGVGLAPGARQGQQCVRRGDPSTWVAFWFQDWQYLAMPAFALGWFFSGAMLRITRSSMLEIIGSDYIKLVRLKGIPEWVVTVKHALKNSLIPILTLAGLNLLVMINVAVVVEVDLQLARRGPVALRRPGQSRLPHGAGVVLMSGADDRDAQLCDRCPLRAISDPRIRLSR